MGSYILFISVMFITLLLIIFTKKNKKTNIESKIFNSLIIANLVGILVTCLYYSNIPVTISIKFFLIYHVIWLIIYLTYILAIARKNKYLTSDSMYSNSVKKIITFNTIIIILSTLIISFSSIYLDYTNTFIYYKGLAIDISYTLSLIVILVSIMTLIINNKHFSKNNHLVILLSLILESIFVVIRFYEGNYNFVTPTLEIFILYLLYFNIENPDLKIINDLTVAKEQAERTSKEKTEFLTSMSHQIRTPINVIDGLSQIIEDETDINSIKDNTKDIRVASKNLVSLVNGILDISLLESGNIKINNKNYETYEMFDTVIELAKSMVITKNLEIKSNISDNIPSVLLGDSERIKQILLNLLSNAIKFTKEGTIELKVTSTISGSLCRLKMSVKDTGSGISKENLHKIFTKFEKIDNNKNSEGNGLGLVITQKIVELMDGKIDVESEYGLGSIFTVTIDQKIVSPITREEQLMNHSNKEVKTFDATGKKVLIVDDNRLNLKVASKLLSSYNIDITTCESGKEFLELIDKNQDFDLILLDDMMPNMSGVETLEIFKKQERVSGFSIPVVVLTANAVTGMKEDYLSKGFDDYLAKPIEKPELNRILKKYLK